MKTLITIQFNPLASAGSLVVEEDGFRRSETLRIADLSPADQVIVADSLAWLASQLPAGFERMTQVVLDRLPDEIIEGEPPVPRFSAAVTGQGHKGERTIVAVSGPTELASRFAAFWSALEERG